MEGLPGYDDWKLATPPEYEEGDEPCCEDAPLCDCAARAEEDAKDVDHDDA